MNHQDVIRASQDGRQTFVYYFKIRGARRGGPDDVESLHRDGSGLQSLSTFVNLPNITTQHCVDAFAARLRPFCQPFIVEKWNATWVSFQPLESTTSAMVPQDSFALWKSTSDIVDRLKGIDLKQWMLRTVLDMQDDLEATPTKGCEALLTKLLKLPGLDEFAVTEVLTKDKHTGPKSSIVIHSRNATKSLWLRIPKPLKSRGGKIARLRPDLVDWEAALAAFGGGDDERSKARAFEAVVCEVGRTRRESVMRVSDDNDGPRGRRRLALS